MRTVAVEVLAEAGLAAPIFFSTAPTVRLTLTRARSADVAATRLRPPRPTACASSSVRNRSRARPFGTLGVVEPAAPPRGYRAGPRAAACRSRVSAGSSNPRQDAPTRQPLAVSLGLPAGREIEDVKLLAGMPKQHIEECETLRILQLEGVLAVADSSSSRFVPSRLGPGAADALSERAPRAAARPRVTAITIVGRLDAQPDHAAAVRQLERRRTQGHRSRAGPPVRPADEQAGAPRTCVLRELPAGRPWRAFAASAARSVWPRGRSPPAAARSRDGDAPNRARPASRPGRRCSLRDRHDQAVASRRARSSPSGPSTSASSASGDAG